MEKTSIKTNTTTKDKAGFTSAELEEKFLKIAKHTTKDSVFRDLFGNTKYLLELYQILHPEDADVKEEDLNIVTIKNVLLDQMYNDLGFRVRDRLVILVEAQSTWSLNILVRSFLYLAQTWQEYIQETRQNVYKSKKNCHSKAGIVCDLYREQEECSRMDLSFGRVFWRGIKIRRFGNSSFVLWDRRGYY